ncbi:MAG: aldehyde dehydrogenase [Acidobacteria bacterium]|nr:aldehyde dehydrogenase [Acidobacteriota bacterium]
MLHIPLLRKGRPYTSLDVARVPHYRTREPFVEVSQANPGLIRRDLMDQGTMREALDRVSSAEILKIYSKAAEYFLNDSLPLGNHLQSPREYVEQVSATTGLPYVLVRKNMQKIRTVLAEVENVLNGLTRGLDLEVLRKGYGEFEGKAMSFYPHSQALGVILPSNSPGVHSLWAPAIALRTPLILKPGSAEPWTPYRMIQALIRAGCPPEVFGYYPADHAGAGEILRGCGRSMLFGDAATTSAWQGNPQVEVHGPGLSKIVIGADRVEEWEKYLDVMVASILENSGRSCINASGIWVPARASEIASALAERLAGVIPRGAEDDEAQLAPFADPRVAASISEAIDRGLSQGGARDITASCREGNRLVSWDGCSYLLPTVVLCEDAEHPLANREYLFPFASVVEVSQDEIPERLGPTLVVTAITSDAKLLGRLLSSPHMGRLNLGAIPTTRVSWDQPHEGNLFDHLYARRAFQLEADLVSR